MCRVMYLDVARKLEQIKSCVRYGGARFLYALNTNTALLNIRERENGQTVKQRNRQTRKREAGGGRKTETCRHRQTDRQTETETARDRQTERD